MAPRWGRKAGVAWVDSEDRVALLDLDHLERPPMILEGSSAAIWQLLRDSIDERTLVQQIAELYEVDDAAVAGPVADFLRELHGLGLIHAEGL